MSETSRHLRSVPSPDLTVESAAAAVRRLGEQLEPLGWHMTEWQQRWLEALYAEPDQRELRAISPALLPARPTSMLTTTTPRPAARRTPAPYRVLWDEAATFGSDHGRALVPDDLWAAAEETPRQTVDRIMAEHVDQLRAAGVRP